MKILLTTGPGLWHEPRGYIVVVDMSSGRVLDCLEWFHTVHEVSHKGVAGAWRDRGCVYAVTESEVLKVDLAPLRVAACATYRWANDLHHVCLAHGALWVCNSGLECVDELHPGTLRPKRTWNLMESHGRSLKAFTRVTLTAIRRSWRRATGERNYYPHLRPCGRVPYYRKMLYPRRFLNCAQKQGDFRRADLRPHVLHPNHCYPYNGDVLVTVFGTGEVVGLRSGTVVARCLGRPHDGVVAEESLYVTDCSANVIRAVPLRGRRTSGQRVWQITSRMAEGFLRGLIVSEDHFWVGLSARRGAPDHLQMARVIQVDRRTGRWVREWRLPRKYGTAVFSLIDVSDVY